MGYEYLTVPVYLESASDNRDKIARYDALITAMEDRIIQVAAGDAAITQDYQLDTGQMRIRATHRSIQSLEEGIRALERSRQRYINRFNGRLISLRPARNIKRRYS